MIVPGSLVFNYLVLSHSISVVMSTWEGLNHAAICSECVHIRDMLQEGDTGCQVGSRRTQAPSVFTFPACISIDPGTKSFSAASIHQRVDIFVCSQCLIE